MTIHNQAEGAVVDGPTRVNPFNALQIRSGPSLQGCPKGMRSASPQDLIRQLRVVRRPPLQRRRDALASIIYCVKTSSISLNDVLAALGPKVNRRHLHHILPYNIVVNDNELRRYLAREAGVKQAQIDLTAVPVLKEQRLISQRRK